MADATDRDAQAAARGARPAAIRADVATEAAEAAEAEAAESASALDVPMHLRIDRELDEQLRARAGGEGIPISALVRRLLRRALRSDVVGVPVAEIEAIARRVVHEEQGRP